MTWELSEQEFVAVLHQTAEKQYHYFVGHCVDRGEVWGLLEGESDWAAVEDDEGNRFLAVWPHPRYAEACLHRDWSASEPVPIEVHEFVDEVIPRLITDEMCGRLPAARSPSSPGPASSAPQRSRSRAHAHRVNPDVVSDR